MLQKEKPVCLSYSNITLSISFKYDFGKYGRWNYTLVTSNYESFILITYQKGVKIIIIECFVIVKYEKEHQLRWKALK